MNKYKADCIIVGGGIAGIVTTLELLDAGFRRRGIHSKMALEGTFLGTCIYTARKAAKTIKSNK